MKDRVIVADPESAWTVVFVLGFTLVVISLIDLGLLFYPPHFASLDWEFGTISATIESLPLPTIGLCLIAASSVARARRGWMWVVSIVTLLAVVVILAFLVIFALDVPLAIRAVEPARRETLYKAVAKTSLMGFTYLVVYLALGIWMFRLARVTGKGA